MERLNEKAIKIFDYIKSCSEEGIPPSVREICSALKIKSTSTVHRYINILVEEGLLEKYDNQNRSIKISGRNATKVPLVGTVTAGEPITAIQNITDYINFQPEKTYNNPLFALKVRGESMINVGIYDGDIVICEKVSYCTNGEIVVALVDNEEATVKRFYKENGHYRLQPENDYMEPIIVDECQILGRVVAMLRYL